MSEQELSYRAPNPFLKKVNYPQVPINLESIVDSKRRIQKLIIKLTREKGRSKEIKTRHNKEQKIDVLKLILECYDQLEY